MKKIINFLGQLFSCAKNESLEGATKHSTIESDLKYFSILELHKKLGVKGIIFNDIRYYADKNHTELFEIIRLEIEKEIYLSYKGKSKLFLKINYFSPIISELGENGFMHLFGYERNGDLEWSYDVISVVDKKDIKETLLEINKKIKLKQLTSVKIRQLFKNDEELNGLINNYQFKIKSRYSLLERMEICLIVKNLQKKIIELLIQTQNNFIGEPDVTKISNDFVLVRNIILNFALVAKHYNINPKKAIFLYDEFDIFYPVDLKGTEVLLLKNELKKGTIPMYIGQDVYRYLKDLENIAIEYEYFDHSQPLSCIANYDVNSYFHMLKCSLEEDNGEIIFWSLNKILISLIDVEIIKEFMNEISDLENVKSDISIVKNAIFEERINKYPEYVETYKEILLSMKRWE